MLNGLPVPAWALPRDVASPVRCGSRTAVPTRRGPLGWIKNSLDGWLIHGRAGVVRQRGELRQRRARLEVPSSSTKRDSEEPTCSSTTYVKPEWYAIKFASSMPRASRNSTRSGHLPRGKDGRIWRRAVLHDFLVNVGRRQPDAARFTVSSAGAVTCAGTEQRSCVRPDWVDTATQLDQAAAHRTNQCDWSLDRQSQARLPGAAWRWLAARDLSSASYSCWSSSSATWRSCSGVHDVPPWSAPAGSRALGAEAGAPVPLPTCSPVHGTVQADLASSIGRAPWSVAERVGYGRG